MVLSYSRLLMSNEDSEPEDKITMLFRNVFQKNEDIDYTAAKVKENTM
jgi:hypothetical protein